MSVHHNPNHNRSQSRSQHLEEVLSRVTRDHGFLAAVLTNAEGLPLSAAAGEDRLLSEVLAAVAPVIERAAYQSNIHSGLESADEVVIQNVDRTRIVCRFFTVNDQPLILACVVPKDVAYRRVMNRAIRDIRQAWNLELEP
ncbi:MAG: roadblock/LC7 domain-containing protein [Ardenticatenia bacterium]|nr:roadblock/LC7 domain-containing protein [Ardenticatenia bacterium]